MRLMRFLAKLWRGDSAAKGRSANEQSVLSDLGATVLWTIIVAVLAMAGIAALAAPQTGLGGVAFVGVSGVVSLAAAVLGGMLGFLFGIPRTLAQEGDAQAVAGSSLTRYTRSNTNLEQVSDWLTKIVIGATLVEIKQLGPALTKLGRYLGDMLAELPGLAGASDGLAGLLPVLIVLFFATGFLTLYLQTRTFLAIMFARTEEVMANPKLEANEVDDLRAAVKRIAEEGPSADVPQSTRELATRALTVQPDSDTDAEALIQHGYAQVILDRVGDGATTLKRAYELTHDPQLGRMVARLLARSQRPGEAKDLLRSSISAPPEAPLDETTADALLTRIFASLYEPPPLGFNEALRLADRLKDQAVIAASAKRRGRLGLYRAAALGQCYSYSRTAGSKSQEELDAIRADALAAVRGALEADQSVRSSLKNMLNGSGQDDDLVAFKDDPDFKTLIDPPAAP